jgi:hypothetical protein
VLGVPDAEQPWKWQTFSNDKNDMQTPEELAELEQLEALAAEHTDKVRGNHPGLPEGAVVLLKPTNTEKIILDILEMAAGDTAREEALFCNSLFEDKLRYDGALQLVDMDREDYAATQWLKSIDFTDQVAASMGLYPDSEQFQGPGCTAPFQSIACTLQPSQRRKYQMDRQRAAALAVARKQERPAEAMRRMQYPLCFESADSRAYQQAALRHAASDPTQYLLSTAAAKVATSHNLGFILKGVIPRARSAAPAGEQKRRPPPPPQPRLEQKPPPDPAFAFLRKHPQPLLGKPVAAPTPAAEIKKRKLDVTEEEERRVVRRLEGQTSPSSASSSSNSPETESSSMWGDVLDIVENESKTPAAATPFVAAVAPAAASRSRMLLDLEERAETTAQVRAPSAAEEEEADGDYQPHGMEEVEEQQTPGPARKSGRLRGQAAPDVDMETLPEDPEAGSGNEEAEEEAEEEEEEQEGESSPTVAAEEDEKDIVDCSEAAAHLWEGKGYEERLAQDPQKWGEEAAEISDSECEREEAASKAAGKAEELEQREIRRKEKEAKLKKKKQKQQSERAMLMAMSAKRVDDDD